MDISITRYNRLFPYDYCIQRVGINENILPFIFRLICDDMKRSNQGIFA